MPSIKSDHRGGCLSCFVSDTNTSCGTALLTFDKPDSAFLGTNEDWALLEDEVSMSDEIIESATGIDCLLSKEVDADKRPRVQSTCGGGGG